MSSFLNSRHEGCHVKQGHKHSHNICGYVESRYYNVSHPKLNQFLKPSSYNIIHEGNMSESFIDIFQTLQKYKKAEKSYLNCVMCVN